MLGNLDKEKLLAFCLASTFLFLSIASVYALTAAPTYEPSGLTGWKSRDFYAVNDDPAYLNRSGEYVNNFSVQYFKNEFTVDQNDTIINLTEYGNLSATNFTLVEVGVKDGNGNETVQGVFSDSDSEVYTYPNDLKFKTHTGGKIVNSPGGVSKVYGGDDIWVHYMDNDAVYGAPNRQIAVPYYSQAKSWADANDVPFDLIPSDNLFYNNLCPHYGGGWCLWKDYEAYNSSPYGWGVTTGDSSNLSVEAYLKVNNLTSIPTQASWNVSPREPEYKSIFLSQYMDTFTMDFPITNDSSEVGLYYPDLNQSKSYYVYWDGKVQTTYWNNSKLYARVNISHFSELELTTESYIPNVTLISPSDGDFLEAYGNSFEFEVTDDSSSELDCEMYINSSLVRDGITASNGSSVAILDVSLPDEDGTYPWSVECTDDQGNTGSDERSIRLDRTAPSVTQLYPEHGVWYNKTTFDVHAYVEDEFMGSCYIWVDVTQVWDSYYGGFVSKYVSKSVSVSEGQREFKVGCEDLVGNSKYSAHYSCVDVTPPYFDWTLQDSEVFNTSQVSFNVTPYDNLGGGGNKEPGSLYCGSDTLHFEMSLQGPESEVIGYYNVSNGTTHQISRDLSEGEYNLTLTVMDGPFGNISHDTEVKRQFEVNIANITNRVPSVAFGFDFNTYNNTYGLPLDLELPFDFVDLDGDLMDFKVYNQTSLVANVSDIQNATTEDITMDLGYGKQILSFKVFDPSTFSFANHNLTVYTPAWDTNGDLNIDVTDLSSISLDYGSTVSVNHPSDVDDSGRVDVSDLSATSLHYGGVY